MTSPEDAVTVGELREMLSNHDDDAPISVAASGAYDFLCHKGFKTKQLKPTFEQEETVYLDGDQQ